MAFQKSVTVLFIWQLLILAPNVSPAQDIQTYEGAFKHGKGQYQYYENENHERVHHGPFFYSCKLANGKYIIERQYTHNKKNGEWEYIMQYLSGKKNIWKGKIVDGAVTGYWTEKFISEDSAYTKSFATFKDNLLYGDFKFHYKDCKVTGQFDENGLLNGEWKVHY